MSCLLAAALLSGCHIERIVLEEPVRDRIVEVDTEDHVVVRLDENSAAGYRWTAESADSFVDIQIEHEAGDVSEGRDGAMGLATVHLRVRRGFTGPASVFLSCARDWSDESAREVKLVLHRRQTNIAGWR